MTSTDKDGNINVAYVAGTEEQIRSEIDNALILGPHIVAKKQELYEVSKANETEYAKLVDEYYEKYDVFGEDYILAKAYEASQNPELKEKIEKDMAFWNTWSPIDFRALDSSEEMAMWSSETGEALVATGNPWGYLLMAPEVVMDTYSSVEAFKEGEYYKGVQYLSLVLISGVEGVNAKQSIKQQVPDFTEVEIDGKTVKLNNRHTIYPEYPDGYDKTGVKGNHNEMNFNDYVMSEDIRLRVIGYKEHPTIDGVFEIEYQIAKKDKTGTIIDPSEYNSNISKTPKKTLYDSSKITDQQMADWAVEASKNSIKLNDRAYKGEYNGLEFIFNRQDDGTFRYFPQIP